LNSVQATALVNGRKDFLGTLYNVNFSVHAGLEKMGFLEKKVFRFLGFYRFF